MARFDDEASGPVGRRPVVESLPVGFTPELDGVRVPVVSALRRRLA